MKSKTFTIKGIAVTAFSDGSVELPSRNRTRRTYGYEHIDGYRETRVGTRKTYVHRIIAEAFLDEWDENLQIDHINGDKADNRPGNLRMATAGENARAFRRTSKTATSKYRGVSFIGKTRKWFAAIKTNGVSTGIGHFEDEISAAKAYDVAAKSYGFDNQALNQTHYAEIA